MAKKSKTTIILVSALVIIFAIAFGLATHFYNFPTWTKDVENMAMDYLKSQDEIYETYGNNARFVFNGMNYNTKTRNSVVKIKVDQDLYLVTVDCVDDEFIVRGYEKSDETK